MFEISHSLESESDTDRICVGFDEFGHIIWGENALKYRALLSQQKCIKHISELFLEFYGNKSEIIRRIIRETIMECMAYFSNDWKGSNYEEQGSVGMAAVCNAVSVLAFHGAFDS